MANNPFRRYSDGNPFAPEPTYSEGNPFAPQAEPEDDKSFGSRFGERVYARGQQKVGGAIQAIGEADAARQSRIESVESAYDAGGVKGAVAKAFQEYQTPTGIVKYGVDKLVDTVAPNVVPKVIQEPLTRVGAGIAETGSINLEEAGEYPYQQPQSVGEMVDDPAEAAKYFGAHILESLAADMLPTIAVGAVGGPAAGLATLAGSVYGEEYSRLRAEGKSVKYAQEEAAFRAAAETIPEMVPLGLALRPIGSVLKKTGNPVVDGVNRAMQSKAGSLLTVGAAEAASENITETANILYDKYKLEEEITFDDFVLRMRDAAIMGFGMGAGMRGASISLQAADKWVKKSFKNQIKDAGTQFVDQSDLTRLSGADLGQQLDQNPAGGAFDMNAGTQINAGQTDVGQQGQSVGLEGADQFDPNYDPLASNPFMQPQPEVPAPVVARPPEPEQTLQPAAPEPSDQPLTEDELESLFDEAAAEVEAEAAPPPQAEAEAEPPAPVPGETRIDDLGVRVADSSVAPGVDAGIADVLTAVNDAGFETGQSASGLKQDYPNPEQRVGGSGYISWFKDKLTEQQITQIEEAANKAGIYVSTNSDLFMSPAVSVRAVPADKYQAYRDGMKRVGKEVAEEMGLPYSLRPSTAFPSKMTVDSSKWSSDQFKEWLSRRDARMKELNLSDESSRLDDASTNRMWDDFVEALTGKPLARTVDVGEIAPKAPATAPEQPQAATKPETEATPSDEEIDAADAAPLEDRLPPGVRTFKPENVQGRLKVIARLLPQQQARLADIQKRLDAGEKWDGLTKQFVRLNAFIEAMKEYVERNGTKAEEPSDAKDTRKGDAQAEAVAETEQPPADLTTDTQEQTDEVREQEASAGREQGEEAGQPETTAGEQSRPRSSSEAAGSEQEAELTDEGEGEATPPAASFEEMVAEAQRWGGAAMKVAQYLDKDNLSGAGRRRSLQHMRMTTKADRDAYLMKKFGIDDTTARDVSNTLTAKNLPDDMTADVEDFKDEPWYVKIEEETGQDTEQVTGQDTEQVADKAEPKKAEPKKEEQKGKLENTGQDLRRFWEQLKADLENGGGSGEQTWDLINNRTQRAKAFSPTPAEDATPGVQRYYNDLRDALDTFADVIHDRWELGRTRGYWSAGTVREQVAKRIDNEDNYARVPEGGFRSHLFDLAREYNGMMQRLADAVSGAKTVEEAEQKLAEAIDFTKKLSSYEPPVWKDETIPATVATLGGDVKQLNPFSSAHKLRALVIDYSRDQSQINRLKERGSESVTDDGGYMGMEYILHVKKQNEAESAKKRAKPLTRPRIDKVSRDGDDVRDGNVTPLQTKKEFGFADIGFGKWVAKGKDQSHLNAAWDAFFDLAERLGLPHKAMGFGGKMHFTIGALGHGKHAAHFSPNQPAPKGGTVPVINLTNTRGDGAVAHEWGHALDYVALRNHDDGRRILQFITKELKSNRSAAKLREKVLRALESGAYLSGSGVGRPGSVENLTALAKYWAMRPTSMATNYVREADKLGPKYWGKDEELFARAWESFIYDTLENGNDYLVSSWVKEGAVTKKNGFRGTPYPEGEERAKFNALFEAMIKSMQASESGELGFSYDQFKANLPEEIRDFERLQQELLDEIPSLVEAHMKRKRAEAEAREKLKAEEEAEKWAKAAEEAAAKQRLEDEARRAEEEAKAEQGDTEDSKPLSEAELESLFDDAVAEIQEERQEEPDTPQLRTEENYRETPEPGTPRPAQPRKTASDLIKKAADEGVTGIDEALTALSKLFPPNKLQSFPPTFSKEDYERAKPHFEQSLKAFQQAGKTLKELFKFLIENLGVGVKPYLIHWAKTEGLSNDLSAKAKAESYPDRGTLEAFLLGKVYEIQNNNDLKAALKEYHGADATEAQIKAGQEAFELALVRTARNIIKTGSSPAAIFNELLGLYESQPNLNSRSSTSMENQAYSTPLPLAYLASRLSGIEAGRSVYEPTAGNGALLIAADQSRTVANEMDGNRAAQLRALGFEVSEHDAVQWSPRQQVDAVIANPPFGALGYMTKVDGYQITKIDHLIAANALDTTLKNNGRATLIIGANKVTGEVDSASKTFFNWLYSHYNVVDHFEVSGDLYRKQGAGWPVVVLTINGRQASEKVFDRTVERYNTWAEIDQHVTTVLGSKEFTGRLTDSPVDTGQSAQDDGRTSETAGGVSGETGGATGQRDGAGVRGGSGVRGDARPGVSDTAESGNARDRGKLADGDRRTDLPDGVRGEPRARDQEPGDAADVQRERAGRSTGKPESLVADGSEYQVEYTPGSAGANEAVLVPVNMHTALVESMNRLREAVGDIDQYVMKKLGYKSLAELHSSAEDSNGFMALQVDTVAAMIYNLESRNRGVIIADQTGVGKGRQAAAMIRYALRNDMVPVFVTAQANLFTDMYDDLLDIGETSARPFIFNADGGFIVDREGGPNKFANKPSVRQAGFKALREGKMPHGTNMLMLTYSQANSEVQQAKQRAALNALVDSGMKPLFIFDESHNIAGVRTKPKKNEGQVPTRAGFFFELIKEQPVVYLSATYAKRPDNMPIFYRTDLIDAVDEVDQLESATAAGGEALQAVVANMLALSGQLWRRERSFKGISFDTVTYQKNKQYFESMSDHATSGLREIMRADKLFAGFLEDRPDLIVEIATELAGSGSSGFNPGAKMEFNLNHSPFASIVHNFISQLLLSMKADWIVEEAIALHKAGKKPVIALNNTMGSFLDAELERGNAELNKPWTGDYRNILKAALHRTRRITLKDKRGEEARYEVPLEMLPPELIAEYNRIEKIIDGLPLQDITVFYIDYIRNKLEEAGIRTSEITGRSLMVDYSDDMKIKKRPDSSKKFRRTIVDNFNKGKTDAVILNAAGSTGLSIHASENFKDQKPRHMLVAQAIPDINILMQMFGRINRTGQTALPQYSMMGLDLPSEQRPLAMTARKMRSLNANTSANTESETSLNVTAILNKYGDQVVHELLLEDPSLQTLTGLEIGGDNTDISGLAMKFTGKLALAPIQEQERAWNEIMTRFETLMDWLEATNQNDLKTETVDLDARIIESKTVYEGKAPGTVFGGNAVLHKITAKVQGRPPTSADVLAAVGERLNGKSPQEVSAELFDKMDSGESVVDRLQAQMDDIIKEWRALPQEEADKKRDKYEARVAEARKKVDDAKDLRKNVRQALTSYQIGSAWKLDLGDDVFTGVVTDIIHDDKADEHGNPFSASKTKIKFMVNGPARQVTVPLSKIFKGGVIERNLYISRPEQIKNLFDSRSGISAYETRYVITGNLLGGYSVGTGGRVVSFTAANGKVYSGILMPLKYGKNNEFDSEDSQPVVVRDAQHATAYLRNTRNNYSLSPLGLSNLPNQEVRIKAGRWGQYEITVPRKRTTAGDKVKFDKTLHKLMGGEFVGRTQLLTVSFDESRLDDVVKHLMTLTTLYVPGSGIESLKQITGKDRIDAPLNFDPNGKDDESLREDFKRRNDDLLDTPTNDTAPKFNRPAVRGMSYGQPTGRSGATGIPTFLTRQLEAAMSRYLGREVKDGTWVQIKPEGDQAKLANVISRLFKRRIVLFKNEKPFEFRFNGVALPRDPKTLYVNVDSRSPFAGVVGHEFTHSIKQSDPAMYERLAEIARSYLREGGFQDFKAAEDAKTARQQGDLQLGDEAMFEELVAMAVGEAFSDPAFIEALAEESLPFYKQVLNKLLTFLKRLMGQMKRQGMGASQYYQNVDGMVAEVQALLRSYRPASPVRVARANAADTPMFEGEEVEGEEVEQPQTEDPNLDDPAIKSFMKRAGMPLERKTVGDRIRDLMNFSWAAAKANLSDSIQLGLFDKFYGIKAAYRDYLGQDAESAETGYVTARLSTGSASVMRGVLLYGAPEYGNDATIKRIPGSVGLLDVFAPVHAELDQFLGWMIARRADRLHEEGKENNFTREEIDAGLTLSEGTINIDGAVRDRAEVYEEVAEEFANFKGAILDLAERAGLIDPISRRLWDKADWIPFYRINQRQGGGFFGKGKGLSHQRSGIRQLRGGKEALNDPLGNIIMNFNHLIESSMKNLALLRTIDDLDGTDAMKKVGWKLRKAAVLKADIEKVMREEGLGDDTIALLNDETNGELFEGISKMWSITEPTDPGVIRVMRGGKPEFYKVEDPMLLTSLANINIEQLNDPVTRTGRAFKTLLTTMVTSEPSFMARNWTRDALHAYVINEDHFIPFWDSTRGLVKSAMEKGGMLDMMFAGGSFQGGYINGTDPQHARKSIRQALRAKGYDNHYIESHLDTIIDSTAGLWDRWRQVGDAFENANREAVYEAAMKAGKTQAQAIYEAKDLMDFSMHGSWTAIRWFTEVVPFLNARLQGLYKLGRSGAVPLPGLIAKQVAIKGMYIAVFSIALAMLNDDDEAYEALEDWDKDSYWHFFPGTKYHTRVPKPFEVGILYGTIPERMFRALKGDDTMGKFWNRMGHAMWDTMAFNPVPQIFKPGMEVWSNQSTFTGRPIENLGDERLLPSARYDSRTSDTMVALGPILEELGLSPKQAEFLWRGYLGTLGNYGLMAADVVTREIVGRPPVPAKTVRELPVIGSFVRGKGPAWNTRYGTELYEMHREVTSLYATVKSYETKGQYEKARELAMGDEGQRILPTRKSIAAWAKTRASMRRAIDQIYRDEKMTSEQKLEAIQKIIEDRNEMDEKNYKYFSPLFGRK